MEKKYSETCKFILVAYLWNNKSKIIEPIRSEMYINSEFPLPTQAEQLLEAVYNIYVIQEDIYILK
jgi:DNA polymerase III delta prime subunit